jgi:hypothetical protein
MGQRQRNVTSRIQNLNQQELGHIWTRSRDLGLISKEKEIIFTSSMRNIEVKKNIVGLFHVSDLL